MPSRKTDTEYLADAQEIIRQKNKLLASQAREIRRLKDAAPDLARSVIETTFDRPRKQRAAA